MSARATRHVVLVHGLWGGAWVWDAVRAHLESAGVASSAVDLPLRTLEGDVAVVRSHLDSLDAGAEVVLVGHSYGGAVVTAAGVHDRVAQLVYLAAFALDDGESIARNCAGHELPPSDLDGLMRTMVRADEVVPDAAALRPLLFAPDVPAPVVDAALGRLRPAATALFRGVPDAIAWRHRPTTYVVCTADRVVHPARQHVLAERAGHVVEWPSDHSPEASRPGEVAALLAESAVVP